jgi:ketosteroid isomerase-like protein
MRTNLLMCFKLGVATLYVLGAGAASQAADLRATIMAADAAWSAAFAQGDAGAVARLYSASGQILAQGSDPVKGTADLTKFLQGVFDEGAAAVVLTTLEVVGQGRYATEVGSYVIKDKAGKEMDHGKYMELWRLEKGVWKLHRDIFNSSVPAKKAP